MDDAAEAVEGIRRRSRHRRGVIVEGDMDTVTIDVSKLFASTGTAKLHLLPEYERKALEAAGEGKRVRLTGAGPVWLYLRIAHVLHGKARVLVYDSPVTGEVKIFDHDPR